MEKKIRKTSLLVRNTSAMTKMSAFRNDMAERKRTPKIDSLRT